MQKKDEQISEVEDLGQTNYLKPHLQLIENSLRESKTFENYLDDPHDSYYDYQNENNSVIKTSHNSVGSGGLKPHTTQVSVSPANNQDKELENLIRLYADIEFHTTLKA